MEDGFGSRIVPPLYWNIVRLYCVGMQISVLEIRGQGKKCRQSSWRKLGQSVTDQKFLVPHLAGVSCINVVWARFGRCVRRSRQACAHNLP